MCGNVTFGKNQSTLIDLEINVNIVFFVFLSNFSIICSWKPRSSCVKSSVVVFLQCNVSLQGGEICEFPNVNLGLRLGGIILMNLDAPTVNFTNNDSKVLHDETLNPSLSIVYTYLSTLHISCPVMTPYRLMGTTFYAITDKQRYNVQILRSYSFVLLYVLIQQSR